MQRNHLDRLSARLLAAIENQSGAIAPLFGLLLLVCCGAVALGIDYSGWVRQRTEMQARADAAALAGARAFILPDGSTGEPLAAAVSYLKANGATGEDAVLEGMVAVNNTAMTVTITLAEGGARYFSGLYLQADPQIRANSIAKIEPARKPICVLALNPTAQKSLEGSGGTSFVANDCVIQVNSTANYAVNLSGGSSITSGTNCFVGGVQQGLSLIAPAPEASCAPVPDPFASEPTPIVGACDHTNFTLSGGAHTLDPGVYCGGITLTGGVIATFNAGVYVINGGQIKPSGGGSLTGNGVVFYLTGADTGVSFSGGGAYHFTAPTTGTLKGFVFYLDPTADAKDQSVISGGGEMYYEGILYFPTQNVVMSGGGTSSTPSPYTMFVADTFTYTGGSQLLINADAAATSIPIPSSVSKLSGNLRLVK